MKNRSTIATALVLISLGMWFLAVEALEPLKDFANGEHTWPLPIIGVGLLLAVVAVLTWTPGIFIPACIVGGIGGLLYWQNITGNWESWAYAWAFIPGFVGIGMVLNGLFSRERGSITGGGWLMLISLSMVAVFGAFLGGSDLAGKLWPVLLIIVGLMVLARGILRR